MANRLSESGASVLLLEAGDWDSDPLIHVPIAIGKIFPERLHDWGYFFQPDAGIDARGIECARGKVIGGCSAINAMIYMRGQAADYDGWRQLGLAGWGWDDVLPSGSMGENLTVRGLSEGGLFVGDRLVATASAQASAVPATSADSGPTITRSRSAWRAGSSSASRTCRAARTTW